MKKEILIMKFSRLKKIMTLAENKTYKGEIFDISKVTKGDYYEIQVKTDKGIIDIWVSDTVTPEHPLYDVFDAYIEDEENAENFDEKEIIGTPITFTVKNFMTKNKKGEETERSFFNKVTPILDKIMEDNSDE